MKSTEIQHNVQSIIDNFSTAEFIYDLFIAYGISKTSVTRLNPNTNTKQKENINLYVFAILDERAKHPSKIMTQLYNLDTMPKGLLQAHQELDTAIEQCYRLQPFKNDVWSICLSN